MMRFIKNTIRFEYEGRNTKDQFKIYKHCTLGKN